MEIYAARIDRFFRAATARHTWRTIVPFLSATAAFTFSAGCSSNSGGDSTASDAGLGAALDSGASPVADAGSPPTGDGGASDAQTDSVSCENYCAIVMTNCTGPNAEYTSSAVCMAMCAKMALGAPPDTSNDTVACRQFNASAAAGSPAIDCPRAGPTGADQCGADHCVAWCALDIALCGTMAYADQASCVSACHSFAYSMRQDIAQTSGNTMNCRIYHLEAAYTLGAADVAFHCPHTGSPSVQSTGGNAGPCQ